MAGKVAIVTGAASGIGQAIAERLGEAGAAVVIADINSTAGKTEAHNLQARQLRAIDIPTDVASVRAIKELVEKAVHAFGRLDIFVNNAGINFVKPLVDTTLEDWEHVISTDLRGTFFGCKYAIEQFLRQGTSGCIVNISSVHAIATIGQSAPYAAAKGGISQLTKSLAIEFGRQGIRVNAVCPGATATQIWEDVRRSSPDGERILDHWRHNIALGREAQPRDVANLVAWLATDEACYITGANLMVDGGMTAMLASRMD